MTRLPAWLSKAAAFILFLASLACIQESEAQVNFTIEGITNSSEFTVTGSGTQAPTPFTFSTGTITEPGPGDFLNNTSTFSLNPLMGSTFMGVTAGSGGAEEVITSFDFQAGPPQSMSFAGAGGAIGGFNAGAVTISASGMASFMIPLANPQNTFGALFNAGTFSITSNGVTYNYIINILAAPTPPSPGTTFTTNNGAINSASTTGLNSMSSTLDNVQTASQNGVGDLNNRIARARWGNGPGGGGTVSTDSTTRYLNFAANQGIDYRVALGLAEGREVEVSTTIPSGGLPFAMAGVPLVVSSTIVVPADGVGSKNPIGDKVVLDDKMPSRFEAFTEFDFGFYDLDDINQVTRASDTDTYAGSAGLEYRLLPNVILGGAFTYLDVDTDLSSNLGYSELQGQMYSGYITAFHGNSYIDFLYSYGDFENSIGRNTLLGSMALGDTDSYSHNLALNVGHTFHKGEAFSYGPSAALNYSTGQVNGYSERNGGAANLVYADHEFESLISRLGGYATFVKETPCGLWTTQFSLNWAHEYSPETGNVTASLQTSPFASVTGGNATSFGSFTASQRQGAAGTDWAELGVVTRLDIANTRCNIELGYQGMYFRDNASGHLGSVKLGYVW